MKSVNGTRVKKPCPECGNLYVNLNDHVRRFHRRHKKKRMVKYCTNCHSNFPRDTFDDHKLVCLKEQSDKTICHICSKEVVQIANHLAKYHQIYDKKCFLCENNFHTISDLNNHIRGEHIPKIMKQPEFNQMDLKTDDTVHREVIAATFVNRYFEKTEEDQIECNFCKWKTSTLILMIVHIKEHLGFTFRKGKVANPEKDQVCPDCGKIVKYQMKDHMNRCKEVKPVDLTEYPCEFCTKLFKKKINLRKHIEKNHGNDRQGKVTLSEQTENQNSEVNLETQTETKLDKHPKFPCDYCKKKFMKKVNLLKHVEIEHKTKNHDIPVLIDKPDNNTVVLVNDFEPFMGGEMILDVVAGKQT